MIDPVLPVILASLGVLATIFGLLLVATSVTRKTRSDVGFFLVGSGLTQGLVSVLIVVLTR